MKGKHREEVSLENPNVHSHTYIVYWKISAWLERSWAGLRVQQTRTCGSGLIEIKLALHEVEWDWMKQCRLNWIRIDRKLMERNTVKCNWKGRTRHEVDWDRSICTTLLYDVTPYTLGCIYTVHFLWCSYDECAVNNRSIGST